MLGVSSVAFGDFGNVGILQIVDVSQHICALGGAAYLYAFMTRNSYACWLDARRNSAARALPAHISEGKKPCNAN